MHDRRLDDKVAVITGSTRGLGRAIATAYAREGARVVVSSRSTHAVADLVRSLDATGSSTTGLACDVADAAQVEALAAHAVATYGRIDIWVNNAGVAGPWARTLDVATDDYLQVVQTNILGTYHGSMAALRRMAPLRSGKLINLIGLGARGPAPFSNAYGPTKAWIANFTLALSREYRDSGVGVFAFGPGMLRTEMITHLRVIGDDARRAMRLLPFALRFLARPPEVAAERAVRIASTATDGRTGRVYNPSRPILLATGLLQEAWRIARRQPPTDIPLSIAFEEPSSSP